MWHECSEKNVDTWMFANDVDSSTLASFQSSEKFAMEFKTNLSHRFQAPMSNCLQFIEKSVAANNYKAPV